MENLVFLSDSNQRGDHSPAFVYGPSHTPIEDVVYEARLEALHAAIEKNQLSAVNRELANIIPDALVLDECYSPHAVRSCRTPLRHAAFRGNAKIVETLLEQPHTSAMAHYSDDSWSALHSAAFQGHDEIVITFLTKSADVHSSARFDGFGVASARTGAACIHSALFNDIASGRVRVEKIDPDKDWDEGTCNIDMTDEGLLPIHLAALGGHYNTVTMLLKYSSSDVSAVSLKHQWTVLHCAVWGGNVALVQEICRITNRKFVNTRDRRSDGSQWTPIAIAVARQNIEMVQCLLSFGADPTESINLADFPGTHFVSSYPEIHDPTDCQCGWSTDDDDITLMHLAIVAGDLAMLQCLVPIITERHRRQVALAAKGLRKSGDQKGEVGFINDKIDNNKNEDPLGFVTAQGWSCAVLAVLLHTVDPETRLQLRFVKGTIANKDTCNRKELVNYILGELSRSGRSCFGEDTESPPSVPQRLDRVCQSLCIKTLESFAAMCKRYGLEATLLRCTHVTLLRACHFNRIAVVRYLLENNMAHPSCPFIKPISARPAHICASMGSGELLQLLIDFGADPCEADEKGRKPVWKLNDFHTRTCDFMSQQIAQVSKYGDTSVIRTVDGPPRLPKNVFNATSFGDTISNNIDDMSFSPLSRE